MGKLVKTKTFWVGLLTIGSGAVIWWFDNDWEKAIGMVLGGLALITGRDAFRKATQAN